MWRKVKCSVCKTRVVPKREKTVHTNTGISNVFSKPIYVDVMDCPKCGCQIALGIRESFEIDGKESLCQDTQ